MRRHWFTAILILLLLLSVAGVYSGWRLIDGSDHAFFAGGRVYTVSADDKVLLNCFLGTDLGPGNTIDFDHAEWQLRDSSLWVRLLIDGNETKLWHFAGIEYHRGTLAFPSGFAMKQPPTPYRLTAFPYWVILLPPLAFVSLLIERAVWRKIAKGKRQANGY